MNLAPSKSGVMRRGTVRGRRALADRHWVLPVGLFVLALVLRIALIVESSFDGLYGQDPYFYAHYAADLHQAISHGQPPPGTSWPVGYPLLVALGLLLAPGSSVGLWLTLLAGAAMAPLVYVLARDLLTEAEYQQDTARQIGVVAGGLTAVSGQLLQSSVVVMSDAPALFWATLAGWTLVRYAVHRRQVWLLGAAFALAWAVMTRWEYATLILPFVAYLWLRRVAADSSRDLIAAALVAGLTLVPQWVLFDGATAVTQSVGAVGWTPLNAFRRAFVTGAGFDRYTWPNAVFYARPLVSPGYLLPVFAPALLLGIVLLARQRRRGAGALLLGWGLVLYVVLVGLPFQSFRYAVAYLPPVVVLAATGTQAAIVAVRGRWQPLLQGAVVVAMVVMAGWSYSRAAGLIRNWQADRATVRWAVEQVPDDATFFSHGLTLIAESESANQAFDLYLVTSDDLARLTTDGRSDYLLVDPSELAAQWSGRVPYENYLWLRNGPGLVPLGQRGRYTLYQIGSP